MGVMNLIISIMTAVSLLSSGSLSELESPSGEPDGTTVTTTTLSWVPSQPFAPRNTSLGVSADDSKETDDGDDSSKAGGGSDDEGYPNPREHPRNCYLGNTSAWLCNQDDVLDAEKATGLNKLLESLVDASKPCPCQDAPCLYTGLPMFVVVLDTIPNYQNKSYREKEEHVGDFTLRFLKDWNSNGCDNGAVTVVGARDRIVVTVIGQASKPLVSDDCQESVENATSSFFEEGRIDEGLTELIHQYRLIVLKSHSCNSDTHLKASIVIPIIIVIALIIVAAITAGVLLAYRRRGSKDIRTEANVPLKDQQQPEKA